MVDCLGECGGAATVDACGECQGDGSACADCSNPSWYADGSVMMVIIQKRVAMMVVTAAQVL